MTPLEQVRQACGALKVFPLPQVVLLPGSAVPLHIFEPRYRALVEDCLASDRVMAMGLLEPGWEGAYQGRPPLQPICCAGLLTQEQRLPDGRFNIVVQGVVRARVLEELAPHQSYRQVRAELLPDAPYQGEEAPLRQAVLELAARLPEEVGQTFLLAVGGSRGGALADVVGAAIATELETRQQLLQELAVEPRIARVLQEVAGLITRLGTPTPKGPLN